MDKILNKRLPWGAPRDVKQLNRMEHNAIGHACIGGAITKANGPRLLTISHRDSPRQRATCWNVGMLDNWKFQ